MTTPEQRARWAALTEAATEGPWEYRKRDSEPGPMVVTDVLANGKRNKIVVPPLMAGEIGQHDCRFIAAAREAVPALLAENAALREALNDAMTFLTNCSLEEQADEDTAGDLIDIARAALGLEVHRG